ncbi:MAG: hypothetical protein AAB874_00740 [Patescibacteria group bacterium]
MRTRKYWQQNCNGYFIMEAILSVAIMGMIAVTIMPTLNFLLTRTKKSIHETEATLLLQEALEVTYHVFMTTNDWVTFTAPNVYKPVHNGKWELIEGSDVNLEALFGRKIEINFVCRNTETGMQIEDPGCSPTHPSFDPNSRKIMVTVSWNEPSGLREIKGDLLVIKQLQTN